REPEPGTSRRARAVAAREAVEGALEEVAGHLVPLVVDVQLDGPVDSHRRQRDLAVPVPQRVVDEIRERLLEPEPVGRDRDALRRADAERAPSVLGAPREAIR